jgi:hypothetical protein
MARARVGNSCQAVAAPWVDDKITQHEIRKKKVKFMSLQRESYAFSVGYYLKTIRIIVNYTILVFGKSN